jgi:hypothetical protein
VWNVAVSAAVAPCLAVVQLVRRDQWTTIRATWCCASATYADPIQCAVAVDADHPPLPTSTSALRVDRVDEKTASTMILIFPHRPSVARASPRCPLPKHTFHLVGLEKQPLSCAARKGRARCLNAICLAGMGEPWRYRRCLAKYPSSRCRRISAFVSRPDSSLWAGLQHECFCGKRQVPAPCGRQ